MPNLARTLRTDAMADMDLRALAQVLRNKGRGKDTVLAHITPQEAKLLKERGGRGSINPDTGLPEFDVDDFAPVTDTSVTQTTFTPEGEQFQGPPAGYNFDLQEIPAGSTGASPPQEISGFGAGQPNYGLSGNIPTSVYQAAGAEMAPAVRPAALQPNIGDEANIQQPSWLGRQADALSNYLTGQKTGDVLGFGLRAGLAGAGGLLGLQARNALQKQGRQAQAQIGALGAPQQAQGAEMIRAAQAGELTPANQQTLEAARAQLAQAESRSGGVGAAQAATQLEALRQNLLNNQYQLGLQVSGIGNQYALAAIQQGLQSNQQAAQLSQQYWQALSQALAGSPTTISLTPRT